MAGPRAATVPRPPLLLMADPPFRPGDTPLPPFVQPMLRALDRMQQRSVLRPAEVTAQAQDLLARRLGTSERDVAVTFAHGSTGLLGGHTHYFDGFALLMPLHAGTAVAVRACDGAATRLVFEGEERTWTFGPSDSTEEDRPSWVRIVEDTVRTWVPADIAVEIAVVSTIRPSLTDAYFAALGVATVRAVQALASVPASTPELMEDVRARIEASTGFPFSVAYPIAADIGRPQAYTLVDTADQDHLPVPAPPDDALGWGLVVSHEGLMRPPAFFQQRKAAVQRAVERIAARAMPGLTSLRELEHRHLQQVLEVLPGDLRPLVRHLVGDNQRVQRLVAALKKQDWQMFGALLLMSHASLRADWGSSDAQVDFVVGEVEARTFDGLYGAFATGRSGSVLVAGRPFAVPPALDSIRATFAERFGTEPDMMLL